MKISPTLRQALLGALWAATATSNAMASSCGLDMSQSQEISVPPAADRVAYALWSYAANYSRLEWQVSVVDGHICAQAIASDERRPAAARPAFEPEADGLRGASRFTRVDDGWLVGFNHGEFGAALYWFSLDGQQHYRMPENQIDKQVVEFFPLGKDLGAIEGLAHGFLSQGSIIRIVRPTPQSRWQVQTAVRLPAAPYAVAVPKRGPALVVLSDSLVEFDGQHGIGTLMADAPWAMLYARSAVLSPDEQTLYIGMRQYVGEFDLRTRKLRMLLPPGAELNRLSQQDERQIRASYSR